MATVVDYIPRFGSRNRSNLPGSPLFNFGRFKRLSEMKTCKEEVEDWPNGDQGLVNSFPSPEKSQAMWICSTCTVPNQMEFIRCEVCGEERKIPEGGSLIVSAAAKKKKDRQKKNPQMDFIGKVESMPTREMMGVIRTVESRFIYFESFTVNNYGPVDEHLQQGSSCVVVAVEHEELGLKAIRVTPCFEKQGIVSHLFPEKSFGIVADQVYFHTDRVRNGSWVKIGQLVFVRVVRQTHGRNEWKATSVVPLDQHVPDLPDLGPRERQQPPATTLTQATQQQHPQRVASLNNSVLDHLQHHQQQTPLQQQQQQQQHQQYQQQPSSNLIPRILLMQNGNALPKIFEDLSY